MGFVRGADPSVRSLPIDDREDDEAPNPSDQVMQPVFNFQVIPDAGVNEGSIGARELILWA
jgi:hypothetical protein